MRMRCLAMAMAAMAILGSQRCVAAEPACDTPLETPPADILRLAGSSPFPKDSDCEVLLNVGTFRLDAQRKLERRTWTLFRIATESAAQERSLVEAVWSPWHEERPTIRARVIRANGEVFTLDPKTISEAPVTQLDASILTDARMLRAPLPGIAAGAIVESEIVWRESRPLLATAASARFPLGQVVPTRKTRVVIEAPRDIPLSHMARGVEISPQETTDASMRHLEFESGPHPGVKELDFWLPDGIPILPFVAFSSGESWSAVSSAYADIVEPKIVGSAVEALVRDAVSPGDDRRNAAVKLTRRLNELVRYTGLEFGDAAITPCEPREVLQRRFGDCKDQAALLVSMLRAAGHPASVALLNAGVRESVQENLPGLSSFNHAIVHVAGDPPLWIDPTDPFTAVGELPLADQGKFALIIDRNTKALVKTPRSESAANRHTVHQRIEVGSAHGSKLTCRIEYTGTQAAESRQAYAQNARDELQKSWTEYARVGFAAALSGFEFTDPKKLDEPFCVTIQCEKSSKFAAAMEGLSIELSPSEIFEDLPWYLLPFTKEAGVESSDLVKSPRKQPLQLSGPYVRELIFHVAPPQGYEPRDLPENATQQLGPATITREFRRDGRAIVATFRFDSGHGRFTPAEVDELRAALAKLAPNGDFSQWLVACRWVHTAYEEFVNGDRKRAIRLYDELTRSNPDEWVHYHGFTQALLASGLGEGARRVARRACELMPDVAAAQGQLGWVLTHDPLGRHFQSGMDWEGAAAAYRKCLDLDPNDATHRWNYAILLEHDRDGDRYAEGADLNEAQQQYRHIIEQGFQSPNLTESLAICLFKSQKLDELRDFLKQQKLPSQAVPTALLAVTEGVASAKAALAAIADKESRRQTALVAINLLETTRYYTLAKELCEQTTSITGLDDRPAKILSMQKRIEESPLDEKDPRSAVRELLAGVFAYGIKPERLRSMVANDAWDSPELESWEQVFHAVRANLRDGGFLSAAIKDRILLLADFETAGTRETGFRVTASNDAPWKENFYVAEIDGKLRVLLRGQLCSELGRHALARLDAGDTASPRQWLNWANEELPFGSFFDALTGHPFKRVWMTANKENPESLRIAAALLYCNSVKPDPAVAILEKALADNAPNVPKPQLQRALMLAYQLNGQAEKALALSSALLEYSANNEDAGRAQLATLRRLGRYDEAAEFARKWIERHPKANWARYAAANLTVARNNASEGCAMLRKLAESSDVSFDLLNSAAWLGLFASPLPPESLTDAERAVKLAPRNSAALHTLAAIQAAMGRIEDAQRSLTKAVAAHPDETMASSDWYVVGQIAEHCGLLDDARQAYARVSPKEDGGDELTSTYRLAQMRLKELGKADPSADQGAAKPKQ